MPAKNTLQKWSGKQPTRLGLPTLDGEQTSGVRGKCHLAASPRASRFWPTPRSVDRPVLAGICSFCTMRAHKGVHVAHIAFMRPRESNWSRRVAEGLDEGLQKTRVSKHVEVACKMINHLLGDEHNQLRARPRGHHVEPVQGMQELVFFRDLVRIAKGKCDHDHISLLALESLDSVDSVANEFRIGLTSKQLLQPPGDKRLLCPVGSYNSESLLPELLCRVGEIGKRANDTSGRIPFVHQLRRHAAVQQPCAS